MNFANISKSAKSTEYGTPIDFFKKLNSIFNFSLDPCTTKANPLGVEHYYTNVEDGLTKPWKWNTYVNPPFGRKNVIDWIEKMKSESITFPKQVYIMLLPARVETNWFQNNVMLTPQQDGCIYFVRGRLRFVNAELNPKNEPHNIGSMLWILGERNIKWNQYNDLQKVIPGLFFSLRMSYATITEFAPVV